VRHLLLLLGLLASASLLVGCPDDDDATADDDDATADDDDATPEELSLGGSFIDNWGGLHTIADGVWTGGTAPTTSTFTITQYDNTAMFLVAQNGGANAWNPDIWSRFDWAWVDTQLYFCQTAYAAASEQDAVDTPAADSSDPASGGCNGFEWNSLTEHQGPLAIIGSYNDQWATFNAFTQDTLVTGSLGEGGSTFGITQYDNTAGWAVAQNGEQNPFNAQLWSRFDWTWFVGALYLCQGAYAAESEEAAAATAAADATDPTASGCGDSDFAWTSMGDDQGFLGIVGSYTDEWATEHTIAWNLWMQGTAGFHVTVWNNPGGWAVAKNDDANEYSPGLWSRFEWTSFDDALYLCQSVFDGATEADALAATPADPADPSVSGCGELSFAWTIMTP